MMNQKQQDRLSMYKAVDEVLQANRAVWQAFAPFAEATGAFRQAIDALDKALLDQAATSPLGATADKDSLVQTAIRLVLRLSRNATAYALLVKNLVLYSDLDRARSYLERLPDNEQIATLQAMLDRVREHAAALAAYQVSDALIGDAQAAIDAAAAVLARPRVVITAHSTATGSIPASETQARLSLTIMDKLLHNLDDDAPDFVRNYQQARILVDRGIRHEDPKKDKPAG